MKTSRIFIGLIILLLIFACEKQNADDNSNNKSFEYEEFSSNLNERIRCVHFIDDKVGFVGGNGKIFRSTNGGLSWVYDSITDLPFYSIHFVTDKIGYAVGGKSNCGGTGCPVPGSIVYKTIDSGEQWNKLNIPYEWSELNSVSFIDENVGFAIGLGLHIKTTDGGEKWEQFKFDYKGLMKKITFINAQTGFCAGLFGNIFKTTDQGESWVKTNNESDGHIYDLCFVNKSIGYAGGQKEMVKSIDGGDNWNSIIDSPSEVYFINFADENNGIAIGLGHYTGGDWGEWTRALFRTKDGGTTWEMEDNIEFDYFTSFYDNFNGYSIVPNKTFKISYE